MSNPFGGFVHTSPLHPLNHEPVQALSSNCIRDNFGPTVQSVYDCLFSHTSGCTFAQLLSAIRKRCRRVMNEDRLKLVEQVGGGYKINRARGPESAGYVFEAGPIRAALIVLIHHGYATASSPVRSVQPDNGEKRHQKKVDLDVAYRYHSISDRARLMCRYSRYVEHARKCTGENNSGGSIAADEYAGAIIEEILVHGRLRSEDVVTCAMVSIERYLSKDDDDEDNDENDGTAKKESTIEEKEKDDLRNGVVNSFKRLVDGGFLKIVPVLQEPTVNDDENGNISGDKRKFDEDNKDFDQELLENENRGDDAKVISLLKQNTSYRRSIPAGSVWCVNVPMFHDSMRAFCLGRLVSERYSDKLSSAGHVVTAALKHAAYQEYSPLHTRMLSEEEKQRMDESKGIFTPEDIMRHLPQTVLHELKNRAGGARSNLSQALVSLSGPAYAWPQVVFEVEEARGHPQGGKFEIALRQLVEHLRSRILHKIIYDSHGEIAARICSILEAKGSMESDAVADSTMCPAKDVREILHRLYRARFIDLMNLQQTKQHNPGTAIYLWGITKHRMYETATGNTCAALQNMRLRRQHEMEVGKDWIERAKESTDIDENEHELDKANYNKFCHGLERLDNAILQLDETLMVLRDF